MLKEPLTCCMVERAGMTVTESVGNHAVFISHPKANAILSEAADSAN